MLIKMAVQHKDIALHGALRTGNAAAAVELLKNHDIDLAACYPVATNEMVYEPLISSLERGLWGRYTNAGAYRVAEDYKPLLEELAKKPGLAVLPKHFNVTPYSRQVITGAFVALATEFAKRKHFPDDNTHAEWWIAAGLTVGDADKVLNAHGDKKEVEAFRRIATLVYEAEEGRALRPTSGTRKGRSPSM